MTRNILVALLGFFLAVIVFTGLKALNFYNAIYKPTIAQITRKLAAPLKPKTAYNILILGYGGPGHDGPYLTDTMMVTHIDLVKKKLTFASVARDIWVSLPTKSGTPYHAKVNSLYETEKFPNLFPDVIPENLVHNTLERITGLQIDNFIGVDFSGFEKAINSLGGVDVNVQTAFTDREYPIDGHETDLCGKTEQDLPELEKIASQSPALAFPCRYETLHFDAGVQHMDGARALKYVRSRHGDFDGSDFGRAARQQRLLEAVKTKMLSINFITQFSSFLDELQNHLATDIPPDEMQKFIGETVHIKDYKIDHLVMNDNDYLDYDVSDDGQSILRPKAGIDNWTDVKRWIKNSIEGITPTPTKQPVTTPKTGV